MNRALGWVRLGAYMVVMGASALAFRVILGPIPNIEDQPWE